MCRVNFFILFHLITPCQEDFLPSPGLWQIWAGPSPSGRLPCPPGTWPRQSCRPCLSSPYLESASPCTCTAALCCTAPQLALKKGKVYLHPYYTYEGICNAPAKRSSSSVRGKPVRPTSILVSSSTALSSSPTPSPSTGFACGSFGLCSLGGPFSLLPVQKKISYSSYFIDHLCQPSHTASPVPCSSFSSSCFLHPRLEIQNFEAVSSSIPSPHHPENTSWQTNLTQHKMRDGNQLYLVLVLFLHLLHFSFLPSDMIQLLGLLLDRPCWSWKKDCIFGNNINTECRHCTCR